ncbi:MAG: hypothetical protein AAB622_00270 [Patescibacteria group bacterium]
MKSERSTKTSNNEGDFRKIVVEEGGKTKEVIQQKRRVVLRNVMGEGIIEYYKREIARLLGLEENYPL